MKKLALLLSLVVLAACGGGGSGSGDSASSGTTTSLDTNKVAPITFNITKSDTTLGKTLALTAPNMRRILITNPNNPNLKGWSKTIDDYQDDTLTPETFTLYVATGYKIEVLDYDNTVTPWNPTYYGTTTFDVTTAGGTINVTVSSVVKPTVTYPPSIVGSFDNSATFTVTADFTGTTIYDNSIWSITGGYSPAAATRLLKTANSTTATVTSPLPISGGADATAYYLQSIFYLKSYLKKSGDNFNYYIASPAAPATPIALSSQSGTITPPTQP